MRDELRVLIVEDHDFQARTWATILTHAGHSSRIVGTFPKAQEMLRQRRWQRRPFQVVLLDLQLPGGDGRELVPAAHALVPRPGVAVLSAHLKDADFVELNGWGVLAIPKPFDDVDAFVRLVEHLGRPAGHDGAVAAFADRFGLTEAEAQLVRLTAACLPREAAAEQLGLAPSTVATYWQRVFNKAGCRSQFEVLAALLRLATDEASRTG